MQKNGSINIKMELKQIRCKSTEWIRLAQDRDQRVALVNTIMKFPGS
jgi:hypothetical protein